MLLFLTACRVLTAGFCRLRFSTIRSDSAIAAYPYHAFSASLTLCSLLHGLWRFPSIFSAI